MINDGFCCLSRNDLQDGLQAAADWILRSHEACGKTGSSGYYSPVSWLKGERKWFAPYPETTGYIIPTLVNYSQMTGEAMYAKAAIDMAEWILTLQSDDGSLPSGYFHGYANQSSVFNTGQVIKGLLAAYQYSGDKRFLQGVVNASSWLVHVQDRDGAWRQYAYQAGFSPSYYTEVCWPLLTVWKLTGEDRFKTCSVKALSYIRNKQKDNGVIVDWGFKRGAKAFTHTIGYAIRGMLESALILGGEGEQFWDCGYKAAEALQALQESKGRLAGQYDETWKPSYWFSCPTGEAQLAICWVLVYRIKGDPRFLRAAFAALDVVQKCQFMPNLPHENKGGIPGSKPLWGKYMKFKYPNWAVKYFMDAIMELRTVIDEAQHEKI
jgi:hypothetical protein